MSNGQRWRRSTVSAPSSSPAPAVEEQMYTPPTDRVIRVFDRDGQTWARVAYPDGLANEYEFTDVDDIREDAVVAELRDYGVPASTSALAAQNRYMLRMIRALLPRLIAS